MGRARRAREAARDNEVLSCTYGAIADRHDEAAIALAKQVTHDRVIAWTGAARVSGVTWHFLEPAAGIELVSAESAFPPGDLGGPEQRTELIRYLTDHPHGMLVVAAVHVDLRIARAALS